MKKISLLDCTLRDGGYYTNWNFNVEMVKDLISIVHVFSSRLYGLRSYKNKINEICKEDTNRTK